MRHRLMPQHAITRAVLSALPFLYSVRLPGRIRTCDLQIRSLKCYPLHHEEIVRGKLIRADGMLGPF